MLVVPAPPAVAAQVPDVPAPVVYTPTGSRAAERAARTLNRRVAPVQQVVAQRVVQAVQKPVVKPVVKKPAVKSTKPVVKNASKTEVVAAPASGRAAAIVAYARSKVGGRYVWAAAGPSQFDCSGLVMMALRQVGISVPHQSGAIAARGRRVPAGQWLPGDILIMPGHVAVYAGGGKMIEAANPSAGIRIAATRGGYAVRFV